MRTRLRGAPLVVVFAIVAVLAGAREPSPAADAIELDAVVVNSHDEVVGGLGVGDFEIREDGKPVEIASVSEVSPQSPGSTSTLVVLMDTRLASIAKERVQYIARMLLSRMTVIGANVPRVAVLRGPFADGEEVFSSRDEARRRIDAYPAGTGGSSARYSPFLTAIAQLADRLQTPEHQRKTIVGVGSMSMFYDSAAPPDIDVHTPEWVAAVSALARANVVLNLIDPAGIKHFAIGPFGVVDDTGGRRIAGDDFKLAVDQIWSEASHYYLIRYSPTSNPRELHTIQAKVRRSGLHIRARRFRGN